jgi:hypothetical protein
MPYITLAEQGKQDPNVVMQTAIQNAIQNRMVQQRMQQSAQAFPLEQQQRQAQATEASATASTIQQRLALQMHAQDIDNQMKQTQLQFEQETNPDRKAQLKAQLDHLTAETGNIQIQGQLIGAQAGEASARGSLYSAEANKANPGLSPYNISETAGKPDAYGNVPVTKKWTDKDGNVVHSEDSFLPGRGQPRVAYKQVVDPETGQLKRVPGVLQEDPNTHEMTVEFPDDAAQPTGAPQRTAVTDGIVNKYFDASTGQPKTGLFGSFSGTKMPDSASDRAQLRQILNNPELVKEYGLNAYSDLTNSLGQGGAQTTAETSPSPPGTGATNVIRPSSNTSSSGNQDDMTRSGDGGPSGAVTAPNLVAPQDTPSGAGVNPLGAPVKAGNQPAAGAPAVNGPVPIMSGRSTGSPGSPSPTAVATNPGTAAPVVSGKKGSKFTDLPVGTYFMQGGVRYKKTSATAALPAEAADASDPSQAAPVPAGQSPSLGAPMGM